MMKMQVLFNKLFLLSGLLVSTGILAQSNTKETETPTGSQPVRATAPSRNLNSAYPANSNSNGNQYFKSEEKSQSVPVQSEKKTARPESLKKAAAAETTLEAPAVTQARMQQQFRINQANASRQYSRRSATIQEQTAMDESVLYLKAAAPESFESAYFSWLAGHYDPSRIADLRKAEKLQPQNTDVIRQKAMYYSVADQNDSLAVSLRQLASLNYFTPGQLAYANDLVLSCDENSTLIVHGFDDYLAVARVNQSIKRVNVVSLDLMQSEQYREVAAKYVAVPAQKDVNVEFLQKLCSSTKKPVFLSMTIPANYFQPIKNNLYVQGLTFVYSPTAIDTYAANNALWFSLMNKKLLSDFKEDEFQIWISNYKVLLSVLKNQLNAHKSGISQEEYNLKLEDLDNRLESIIKKGR